jgi:acetyl-CoA carboxylase biotin carboxyl carrier protein
MNIPIESIVTGIVWKIERAEGDAVQAGDTLLILESMKMEIPIEAPEAGVVESIRVHEGESVNEGQIVANLAPRR